MEQRTFIIKKSALAKALLYGHLVNILFGLMIFSLCHLLFKLPTIQSVIYTIVGTMAMSVVVSWLGTKKLSKPIAALNKELEALHQKVSTSANALSRAHKGSVALIDSLPIGFLVFNSKNELTNGNKSAYKLLGYQEDEKPDTHQVLEQLKTLKSSSTPLNFMEWLTNTRTSKIQLIKRWPFVTVKNGEETVAFDIVAHYNKADSFGNDLVVLFIDRTNEYDRQEKQMEFISLAAHELRGPITVMRGLVDILKDEAGPTLSQEHNQLITRIMVSARQLAGYVDNILGASRIDRDSFEVHPARADWNAIVTQSMNDLSVRATAHHRNLEIATAKNLPLVAVDAAAIMHVLNNLVDNAIKYSPENGKVIINAEVKDDFVETTIQDFGIGIPANVVENLFTKFYRSHRSKQIVSGTGLGLYLCKAIVEAHGGSIWVRSSEGSGTTFGFTLPTYDSVADQIKASNNEEGIIRGSHGWIKNHALYRR
jgi:signal transduction histidine kinase